VLQGLLVLIEEGKVKARQRLIGGPRLRLGLIVRCAVQLADQTANFVHRAVNHGCLRYD